MDDGERRRLERTREVLLRRVAGIREFVRGSVVLMRRRCTYPGCRKCAAGERHPTWVLTVSERGKTRTVYLGKGRAAAARTMAANYRRLQEWLEAAARLNLELLTHAAPPTAKGVRWIPKTPDGRSFCAWRDGCTTRCWPGSGRRRGKALTTLNYGRCGRRRSWRRAWPPSGSRPRRPPRSRRCAVRAAASSCGVPRGWRRASCRR